MTVNDSKYNAPEESRKRAEERLTIQVPSIRNDMLRSLQTTDRNVFYSTYWEDRCLPALHPIFHSATLLRTDHPILNDAILALSSCNIGRLHAERKTSSTELMSPSLLHQTRSHFYYSSAIKKLTAMNSFDYYHDPTVILTVLVLFAHLESAMGNFQGFYCHVRGMMNLLEEREGVGDVTIKSLLTSWMQIRYVVWWARVYFSSLDISQQIPSITLPILLRGAPCTLHERRVQVLSIMCESHRLNFKVVLQHFRNWGLEGKSELDESYADCITRLSQEAASLDEWLLHLPPSEQPIYGDNGTIHFHSHDAALNYAYYTVARIMQCTGLLRLLCNQDTQLHEQEHQEEFWALQLLKTAQGINMQTSLTRNSYTIGFSGLLLAAILRCQNLSIGLEIQNWLQTLKDLQPTEEGAFPVYQTLSVVKVINQQRMVGRDVFAVTQPVDDGGGTPKVTAYNSQFIRSLVFYGRCNRLGCLFEECIALDG
ncbi:hypothetical protein MW887_010299 [Aspergillus wentii]|nr:hypothetical protein MW887_010299 [Aspergillus wentii]